MINDEHKKQMLNIISMYDRKAEDFLKKLYDDGIKIVMVDSNGMPLRDKQGNLRYNTVEYFGTQSTQRASRYALLESESKKQTGTAKILEFGAAGETSELTAEAKEPTPEAVDVREIIKADISQFKKIENEILNELIQGLERITGKLADKPESPYLQALQLLYEFKEKHPELQAFGFVERHLHDLFLTANHKQSEWDRLVAIAKIAKLEQELRADFIGFQKNKRLTTELQNIQRTKDFILYNIKHKPNMHPAELQAYVHELKEIKAILENKKTEIAVKPVTRSVNKELLNKLTTLKKLISVGLGVLLNSEQSSAEEKLKFDELSIQISDILNFSQAVTDVELQERIKRLAAAKVFLDKWLPEIAQRQTKPVHSANHIAFFSEIRLVEPQKLNPEPMQEEKREISF